MTLSEKIQELNDLWGKCIAGYHKSCDPIHYISIKYSFGNVEYIVEHNAYIGDDIREHFCTIRAAQEYLCRELIRQIEDQINFNISRCNDPTDESEMPLDYWLSLQKTFELVRNYECSDSGSRVNYEELFLELKQKYESQNYHFKEVEKILDIHNVDKYDGDDKEFQIEYSLNYRVDLLVEKLRSNK